MQIRIGTSGFQYPEWKGSFYPEDLPASKMLAYYAERFGSTEINYTFRQLPSPKSIENWSRLTPEDFTFSFKASQRITHIKRLKECEESLQVFHKAIQPMGDKLGAVLFQLPPNLRKDLPRLTAFLAIIPKGMHAAFEFRHDSWFDDETFAALKEHHAALCLAEDDDLATPREATAPFGYLRLRRTSYSPEELESWADFIRAESRRWQCAYIYFKHEETGTGPKFAEALKPLLKEPLLKTDRFWECAEHRRFSKNPEQRPKLP